jgi:hypothetical protein
MAHTIAHPPRQRLARPAGTPSPPRPAQRVGARARASCPAQDEPDSGGDGELAGDRHGDAGAG